MTLHSWWRGLPTETRVKWIASILLVFAGTEALVLAPFIFDLAALIDAFGILFVLAAGRASVGQSLIGLALQLRRVLGFVRALFCRIDAVADFGANLPVTWHRRCLAVDAFAARVLIGCCVLGSGAVLLWTLAAASA